MDYTLNHSELPITDKDSNITQSACRTTLDVAFFTSYTVAGLLIFIGNLFTCAVFLSKQQLRRTYMNIFLISLACSDFLMAVLVLPGFTLFCTECSVAPFRLPPESRACSILDGLKDVVFLATIFNVLAITFDRYQAVLQSLRYRSRINKKTVTFILVLVWLVPWPLAYLKTILRFADPLIFQGKHSMSIYDNTIVFACIILPMVILLVVNTLLTKAIKDQQAKISIPGNLYLTGEEKQEMEGNGRKNGTERKFESLEKKREQDSSVRRDNNNDRLDKHTQRNVNESFHGDDNQGEINGNNLEESKDHVLGAPRDYHVTVPSINLPSSSYSSQFNLVKNDFQGDGSDQNKVNAKNAEEQKDHVTFKAEGYNHVTATSLNLRITSESDKDLDASRLDLAHESSQGNSGENKITANFEDTKDHVTEARDCNVTAQSSDPGRPDDNDENVVPLKSNERKIQSCDVRKENIVDRKKSCEVRTIPERGCKLEHDNKVTTMGTCFPMNTLKATPKRKNGCVVEPLRCELMVDELRFEKENSKDKYFDEETADNETLCGGRESGGSVKEMKEDRKEKQKFYARNENNSGLSRDSFQKESLLEGLPNYNIKFIGAKTNLPDGKEKELEVNEFVAKPSYNLLNESFLDDKKTSSLGKSDQSDLYEIQGCSSYQNSSFSVANKIKNEPSNKVRECCAQPKYKREDQDEITGTLNVANHKDQRRSSSTTESEAKTTFEEQKKPTENSNLKPSCLVSKNLRIFSREKERNRTRSCLMVALIFVTCWMPRCLHNFFLFFSAPDVINMYLLEKCSMLFLFLQSLTNPLVYSFYRSDFRQTAKELIRKIINCRRGNSPRSLVVAK